MWILWDENSRMITFVHVYPPPWEGFPLEGRMKNEKYRRMQERKQEDGRRWALLQSSFFSLHSYFLYLCLMYPGEPEQKIRLPFRDISI